MSIRRLAIAVTFLLGCGGAAAPQPAPATPAATPAPAGGDGSLAAAGYKPVATPPELRAEVERAIFLGGAVNMMDTAAAQATDLVLARIKRVDPRVGGWTTRISSDGLEVHFVGGSLDAPEVFYIVHMGHEPADGARLEIVDPPVAADAEVAAMYRARTLVSADARALVEKAGGQLCDLTYNTVVIPARLADETGWYVYLLAATTDPTVQILGGHHRVHVDDAGTKVLDVKPLSRGCLVATRAAQPDHKVVGAFVQQLLGPAPFESHVFTSLTYQLPLIVSAIGHQWIITGDQVQLVEQP